MSEDPIIAIRQVVECIDEGCVPGSGHVTSGWLRRASKDEILDWVWGNLRGRVINALKRAEEKMDSLMKENKRAIKLFESLSEFVAWYEEKTDDLDGIAERAIKVLDDSTSVGCEIIDDYVRLNARLRRNATATDLTPVWRQSSERGIAGYRGIAEYLLSPVKEVEPCTRATDATI